MNSCLHQLSKWYSNQCNGDWEHDWGVKINTLDNPGWTIEINLDQTELDQIDFKEISHRCDDGDEENRDWYRCWKEDKTWHSACGPDHLEKVLTIFLDWAEKGTVPSRDRS